MTNVTFMWQILIAYIVNYKIVYLRRFADISKLPSSCCEHYGNIMIILQNSIPINTTLTYFLSDFMDFYPYYNNAALLF